MTVAGLLSSPLFVCRIFVRFNFNISQVSVTSHRHEYAWEWQHWCSLLRLLSCRELVSLSSVLCSRLWWRGRTKFQLWLQAVICLLVSVMRELCVSPGVLQDEFPNHYSVLCLLLRASLDQEDKKKTKKKLHMCCFNVSQMPAVLLLLLQYVFVPWWKTDSDLALYISNKLTSCIQDFT